MANGDPVQILKDDLLWRQGILSVYMREPILDWQREGRLLKDARTDSTQAADTAEDIHIAAKVFLLFCHAVQRGGLQGDRLLPGQRMCVYLDVQPCRCRLQRTSCRAGIPLTFCWLSWRQSTPPLRTGRLCRSEAQCCSTENPHFHEDHIQQLLPQRIAVLHDTPTRPRHGPRLTRVSDPLLTENGLFSTDTFFACPFDTRFRHGCEPCRRFQCRVRATLAHCISHHKRVHNKGQGKECDGTVGRTLQ